MAQEIKIKTNKDSNLKKEEFIKFFKNIDKFYDLVPLEDAFGFSIKRKLNNADKKLCTGGVDDSNGTVGGFITDAVEVLKEYVKLDKSVIKSFKLLLKQETCFGWEDSLVKIFDERNI